MVRLPTLDLCACQCGAGCCRSPGHVFLSNEEARRLRRLAVDRGLKAPQMTRHDARTWAMSFDVNGGACRFLDAENRCLIYAERPDACRRFPVRPTAGCLVWPGEAG